MDKRRKIALSILTLGLLGSGVIASIAWFQKGTNSFGADISGSIVEDYFHCGSGTVDDPFVITRPVHYYHLTEFFQRKTVLPTTDGDKTFGTDYLYFQVGYPLVENDSSLYVYDYDNTGTYTGTPGSPSYSRTLNMSYFSGSNALMPVGTNEIPFFGSFDGGASRTAANGITIANLNIKTSDTVLVNDVPTNRSTSDAGVFGYVADQKDAENKTVIANAYFNNLTIDLSGASNSASDAGHISSHTDNKIYVGYIVGHMHTYTRCGSAVPPNSSPIHDVYVNNATIEGGAEATCNFGYVGHADMINGVSGDQIDISNIINNLAAAAGGGIGDDWGGSIPFNSFNERLFNSLKTTSTMGIVSKNTSGTTISSGGPMYRYYLKTDSKLTVYRGGDSAYTYFNSNPSTNAVVYNMMGETASYGSSNPGTVLPLQINADYTVNSKNTGYITADSVNNSNGTVRSASYKIQHICGSLGDYSENTYKIENLYKNTYAMSYNSSKFEVLTNRGTKSSNGYALISDEYNSSHTPSSGTFLYGYRANKINYETLGLVKYKEARDKFGEVLTGASFTHGIHFYGKSTDTQSRVTYSNPYTITAKINGGDPIANYPLPRSCVDFNLKEQGYITLFAGTYYPAGSDTEADSILSLFKVTRSANNTITNIQRIQKIFNNPSYDSSNPASEKYLYSFNGNTPSGASANDQVFDVAGYLESIPQRNIVCYFEIPVNAGEYAIGGVTGKEAGAYLMYLDIGTSGAEEGPHDHNTDHMISNDPIFTQIEYVSSGYVINSCFNIAYVVPAGSTKETFAITVSRSGDVFSVIVVNTTANVFRLHVLLVDNDSNPDNVYPYSYTLKYNSGDVSTPYTSSGSYQGAASGTVLERLLT